MQATLSTKSQITLPKALQQWLGVNRGDKLHFVLEEGGARMSKVAPVSFASVVGVLPKPRLSRSLGEMDQAVGQMLAKKHAAR
jgi:bifunctional DNA-binding transcriptional regulator/antitoxin component of YhaV-PrlF toxin-antitoxin module